MKEDRNRWNCSNRRNGRKCPISGHGDWIRFEMNRIRGAQNDEWLFCTATQCPRVTWRLPYFEFAAFWRFHFFGAQSRSSTICTDSEEKFNYLHRLRGVKIECFYKISCIFHVKSPYYLFWLNMLRCEPVVWSIFWKLFGHHWMRCGQDSVHCIPWLWWQCGSHFIPSTRIDGAVWETHVDYWICHQQMGAHSTRSV